MSDRDRSVVVLCMSGPLAGAQSGLCCGLFCIPAGSGEAIAEGASGGAAGRENKAGSGTPWRKEGPSPRKQLIELNSACCFSSVQQFLCHGKQKIVILICFTVWFVISIEFVLQRSVGKGREI